MTIDVIKYLLISLSTINFIIAVIYFIGYWTYADFYTNLSDENKVAFTIIQFITYGSILITIGPNMSSNTPFEEALLTSIAISGVVLLIFIICFIVMLIITMFSMSRKYFGKKRNKI